MKLSTVDRFFQNYYDAVAMCRVMGGGDLAEVVKSFPAADKYCKRARGGCAPSLVNHRFFHQMKVL
jgi:hypothetical protein